MKKIITTYKSKYTKPKLHEFVQGRTSLVYAKNGLVKTYSNKTQAEKQAAILNDLGFRCGVSLSWPYTIVPLF